MSTQIRKLSYSLAINEAIHQAMERDKNVVLVGQGVKSPWYVGNTANGLIDKFGSTRVIDTPVSENAMTGLVIGAALAGLKAISVHPRIDFMMYAIDPIINQAANWLYMSGGQAPVPAVIWGIINRGGEQAAQHSQALHALFCHIPGLKVIMPSNPYDAKGLMIAAIEDKNPVVFIDDRWLYESSDHVPTDYYSVPIGKAVVKQTGTDITMVAASYQVKLATEAAARLKEESISTEIVDLRTARPLDKETILNSVKKTGRLVVIDGGYLTGGLSAEIAAIVAEEGFTNLKAPVRRIALPDAPAPASKSLEQAYYLNASKIYDCCKKIIS